jgi:hypothetical protein
MHQHRPRIAGNVASCCYHHPTLSYGVSTRSLRSITTGNECPTRTPASFVIGVDTPVFEFKNKRTRKGF